MDLDSEEFIMALAQKVLTVKSPSWRYEREIRIINVKSGIFKIPRSFIKGICFGLQTPDNDIELIYEIVNKFKNKVDFNRVVKSKSDFDIDIEEYNLALPADS